MIEIRKATIMEIEKWWDINNPNDDYYKNIFVIENQNGKRKTFYAWVGNKNIGQATLILNGKCAEINKLEVVPEYRGRGISSQIIKHLESYARQNKIKTLTIGVEPKEVRNMQIYFGWGYTTFVSIAKDEKEGYQYIVYSKQMLEQ